MRFEYTYRDERGAICTKIVDAPSRADLYKVLKESRIGAVLSLKEVTPDSSRRSCHLKYISIYAGSILATIGTIVLFMSNVKRGDQELRQSKKFSDVTHMASKELSRKSESTIARKNEDRKKKSIEFSKQELRVDSGSLGKKASTNAEENVDVSFNRRAQTFATPSDQILSMVVNNQSEEVAPLPLSDDLENSFLQSLNIPIVIEAEDDEQVRTAKLAVIEARDEVKRLMAEGLTFRQIIAQHQDIARQNAEIRRNAIVELKSIIDSGDIEGAKTYKRKINLALAQMGISELTTPVTEDERKARIAEKQEYFRMKREQNLSLKHYSSQE